MEENFQYGTWKNRLPFHSIPCPANKWQSSFDFFSSMFNLVVIKACCKSSAMLMGILHFGKIKIKFWQNFVMDRVHKLCYLKLAV